MFTSQSYSLYTKGLVLLLLLMMMYPGRVSACSCAYDPNLTETERALENLRRTHHEIVFVGEVAGIEHHPQSTVGNSMGDAVYITFAVQTVYKGNVAPDFTLTTSIQESACGYDFVRNETYLVFVGDDFKDGSWNSGLCSGNQLNPPASLLAVLGEGTLPAADGDSGETWPEAKVVVPTGHLLPSYSCLWSGAVLLVVGTAVVFWAQQRTKKP